MFFFSIMSGGFITVQTYSDNMRSIRNPQLNKCLSQLIKCYYRANAKNWTNIFQMAQQ